MAVKAASVGLEVNWQKTKVQALVSKKDEPPDIAVQGQVVVMVEEFVYLGALIHSSTHISPYIIQRSTSTHTAIQRLDNEIWQSHISTATKLKLYNTCILAIFLYISECWAVTKDEVRKINTFDQWCLQCLLCIKWYQFVSNAEVWQRTSQSLLTTDVQSRCLHLLAYSWNGRQHRC